MQFTLRPAQNTDILAMCAIEAAVEPYGWKAADFESCLQQACSLWVAINNQQILGFCVWQQVLDEVSLLSIAVEPEQQGKGIGKALLQHCIAHAQAQGGQQLFLEVRASNLHAIAFYEHANFNEMGRRRHYYRCATGREDAFLMGRIL
jgi:ribosomal-protein-alanine N-acetyltransferase